MELELAVYAMLVLGSAFIIYAGRWLGFTRRMIRELVVLDAGILFILFPFFVPRSWLYTLIYNDTGNGSVPVYVYTPEKAYLLYIPLVLGIVMITIFLYMVLVDLVRIASS